MKGQMGTIVILLIAFAIITGLMLNLPKFITDNSQLPILVILMLVIPLIYGFVRLIK